MAIPDPGRCDNRTMKTVRMILQMIQKKQEAGFVRVAMLGNIGVHIAGLSTCERNTSVRMNWLTN
jgi:hypothetical protein